MSRPARILTRALRLRCPFCGRGRIFRSAVRVRHECAHCGLRFHRERGYFAGGMELHWLTVFAVPLIGHLFVPVPALWLAVAVGLVPLAHRHARALWMALDMILDPVERELPTADEVLARGDRPP